MILDQVRNKNVFNRPYFSPTYSLPLLFDYVPIGTLIETLFLIPSSQNARYQLKIGEFAFVKTGIKMTPTVVRTRYTN